MTRPNKFTINIKYCQSLLKNRAIGFRNSNLFCKLSLHTFKMFPNNVLSISISQLEKQNPLLRLRTRGCTGTNNSDYNSEATRC